VLSIPENIEIRRENLQMAMGEQAQMIDPQSLSLITLIIVIGEQAEFLTEDQAKIDHLIEMIDAQGRTTILRKRLTPKGILSKKGHLKILLSLNRELRLSLVKKKKPRNELQGSASVAINLDISKGIVQERIP
jgi:hypothetical protein